ncbi:MAG: hypothetical protein ACOC33_03995 [bacterium]
MGGFTKIRLKDNSQENINKINVILDEMKLNKIYRFCSENDVQEEYECYKKGDGEFPEHLFPTNKIHSYEDFKNYWSTDALGEVFVPKFGTLTFDCYYDRTPMAIMNKIGKFLIKNIDLIGEVEGSYSTFIEKINLPEKDKKKLLSLEKEFEPEKLSEDEQYIPDLQSGLWLCKSWSIEPFWVVFGNVKSPVFLKEKIYKDDLYNNIYRDKKGYAYLLMPLMPMNDKQLQFISDVYDRAYDMGLRENFNFIMPLIYNVDLINYNDIVNNYEQWYTKEELNERFKTLLTHVQSIFPYNNPQGFVWDDRRKQFKPTGFSYEAPTTITSNCSILTCLIRSMSPEIAKETMYETLGEHFTNKMIEF